MLTPVAQGVGLEFLSSSTLLFPILENFHCVAGRIHVWSNLDHEKLITHLIGTRHHCRGVVLSREVTEA